MCTYNNTNCLKEFCKEGIKEWLNQDADLTHYDIEDDFSKFCNIRICLDCEYVDKNCRVEYISDNFNIINGKITRRQK